MSTSTLQMTIQGRSIRGIRGGSGRPLLYLHSAMGEVMWLPHLFALTNHVDLVVPAHPGFLESEGLDTIRDMEDLVFHYLEFFDQMGWESVDVVGYSLGGWIAAEIASRYPERISKLVLASSVGIWLHEDPIHDIFVMDIRFPERIIELNFHDLESPMAQMLRMQLGPNTPEQMIINSLKAMAATAKLGWNPLLHNPRLAARLGRITCPTLCLWGEHDRIVSPAYATEFARRIPNAEVRLIAEAGHMACMERADEWVEAVTGFLA
jgi:pimeloyl-ACP methyl ester carboxylesterase